MNQSPEQLARDKIDAMLTASGWVVQSKKQINLNNGAGIAVREYQTSVGPADYVLFVYKPPGTTKYTTEQVQWLPMIKDYIANSFHVDRDDFELDPFNKQGGLGKMWQLFGEETDAIIKLNERLVA